MQSGDLWCIMVAPRRWISHADGGRHAYCTLEYEL